MGRNPPRQQWAFVPEHALTGRDCPRKICAGCGELISVLGKRASICWPCFRRDWNLAMRQRGQQIRAAFAASEAAA